MNRISPDEQWAVFPTERGMKARPIRGGSPVALCDRCIVRWPLGGKTIELWFRSLEGGSGTTVAIPLNSGSALPPLPPDGFQSAEEAAKLPGALVIPFESADAAPGLSSSAYMKRNSQQNIFQIPLE